MRLSNNTCQMAGQISVGMERGIFRSVSNSGTILAEMRNIDDRFDASYLTSFTVERFNCFSSLLSDRLFFSPRGGIQPDRSVIGEDVTYFYTFRVFYPRNE